MDLTFEELEPAERRITRLAEDIGYITLCECLDRNHEETIARVEFNGADLAPFLIDGDGLGSDDEADGTDPEPEQLAVAVGRWLRFVARANMGGRRLGRFKLRVMNPKGEKTLFSARFLCRNADADADTEDRDLEGDRVPVPMPTVVAPSGEVAPEGRTWKALGDAYMSMIALLQSSYTHLAGLQSATIVNQNNKEMRLQGVLEGLMADVIALKVGMTESGASAAQDAGNTRMQQELAKTFIGELGTFGRAFAAAKMGLPPDLAELVASVQQSPELLEVLSMPELKEMLKDPDALKEVAQILKLGAMTKPTKPPKKPPTDDGPVN